MRAFSFIASALYLSLDLANVTALDYLVAHLPIPKMLALLLFILVTVCLVSRHEFQFGHILLVLAVSALWLERLSRFRNRL
jgi:hypothetical protein